MAKGEVLKEGRKVVFVGDQKACGGRKNHQVRVTNLGIHLKPTKTLILERQGKFQVFVLERTVITHTRIFQK